MSGDTTIQMLKRLSWLPERDTAQNGHLIGGQDYYDVYFTGGEISNVTLTNVTASFADRILCPGITSTDIGSATAADSLDQPGIFSGGTTPTAGNLVGIAITKTGYEEAFLGVNKSTVTGSVPANAVYLSTYNSTGQIVIGRGNTAGLPNSADILVGSTGNVTVAQNLTAVGNLAAANLSGTNTGNQTTAGTTNRITVTSGSTSPVIDIAATYVGQTSITTLGNVIAGTWSGTAIDATHGGTAQTFYATGDIIYSSGANTLAKRTIGSTGNVLTVAGGVPTWAAPTSGGWVPIKSVTAANVSAVTFVNGSGGVVFDSTYRAYAVVYSSVIPATDNISFMLRTSTNAGSSYDSGASDYVGSGFTSINGGAITAVGGNNSRILLNTNAGNNTGENAAGVIYIFNPSAVAKCLVMVDCVTADQAGTCTIDKTTYIRNTAADVDAIQLAFITGNITSGYFTLYGLVTAP